MHTTLQVNVKTNNKPGIAATPHYQVSFRNARWNIVRSGDGYILCVCRDQEEAFRMAKEMNRDYEKNSKQYSK